MNDVSLIRLYVLRLAYLIIAVGLGLMIWPKLISHTSEWALRHGNAVGMLSGVQILALVGIRYPLKMLPLLFYELVWKTCWLLFVGLPLWRAGEVNAATAESIEACIFGVVLCLIAIPWKYAYVEYVRTPGSRWTNRPGPGDAARGA